MQEPERCDWLNFTRLHISHVTELRFGARLWQIPFPILVGRNTRYQQHYTALQLHALMPTAIRESGMGAKLLQAGLLDRHAASV